MIKAAQNLHTHTTFCDGKNSVEEMIISALEKSMKSLGLSGHALTEHDTSYCMSYNSTLRYRDEVLNFREKYKDRIKIYLGLEQDYYSVPPFIKTDYLIGSVHYVLKNGEYIPVDETKQIVCNSVNRFYNGDIYAFLEDYYQTVSDVFNKTKCDIVGHFDLPEKFNSDNSLFDREHPRYIAAYEKALKTLICRDRIFEINTGGMSKGYTNQPYPSMTILKKIARQGGRITVTSDSHAVSTIDYKLDSMCELAYQCGFEEIWLLGDDGFFSASLS